MSATLAILSLLLAHYAGFLVTVPLQMVAVAGVTLAKGVSTTFVFYVLLCAVFARVFAAMFHTLLLPGLALGDRLQLGLGRQISFSKMRKFVQAHRLTIKHEGQIWFETQAMLFVFAMLALYVHFTMTWWSGAGLAIGVGLTLASGLIRIGFSFQLQPRTFVKKLRRRSDGAEQLIPAGFVTLTAALVVVSFFLGTMRQDLLAQQQPYTIVTKDFSGVASVVASSDGALLLLQKHGADTRYIYSTPEFTAAMESKPVFEPIGGPRKP